MKQIEFHPAAIEESRAAYQWYAERSHFAAQPCQAELDLAIHAVAEAPVWVPGWYIERDGDFWSGSLFSLYIECLRTGSRSSQYPTRAADPAIGKQDQNDWSGNMSPLRSAAIVFAAILAFMAGAVGCVSPASTYATRGYAAAEGGVAAPQILREELRGAYRDDATMDLIASESNEQDPATQVRLASVQDAAAAAVVQRVLIYSAALRVVVPDVEAALKQAQALAGEYDGYMQELSGDRITLRVPAARFEEALARLESLGRVVQRDIKAQDVTEEYVDLQARLRNAERLRDRLLALLEKAENVQAILEVERELGRVNQEIERLTGQLNLLNSRAALSAVTIQFERAAPLAGPSPAERHLPFPWLRSLRPEHLWR